MCKRLLIVASVMFMTAPAFAAVGVFDFNVDIGNPEGIGNTQYIGIDRYLITGGGGDIWGNADQFHYAYNEVGSADIRLSMKPSWQADGDNDWSKNEVMLRESLAAGSIHYSTATRGGGNNGPGYLGDSVFSQRRMATDGGSGGTDWWGAIPDTLGVQRINSNGYTVVQSLVDQGTGNGWEVVHQDAFATQFAGDLLAGVAVTSHQNNNLVQAWADDVQYSTGSFIGVRAGNPLDEACGDIPGFLVSVAKLPSPWGFWGDGEASNGDDRADKFNQAEYLVKNGTLTGYVDGTGYEVPAGIDAVETGTRIRELVNLADDGAVRAFTAPDHPDYCFPGVDSWTDLADDTDGDDQFGVVVEACVELTQGIHVFGGAFDDGILIRVGGVEIGRTTGWNDTSVWVFEAPVAGIYALEAVGFEEGGGAFMEMYEYLPDGTMILMGDVANGASPVFVPEPATIALLGFGGLSMLRIRRKR